MFKKVLIVDDHDDINKSVLTILKDLNIQSIINSQYCDDAFLKIKKADFDKAPFDLLITDLSFKKDHRDSKLSSGEDLIAALRKDYKSLPIVVYSMKDQLQKVRLLVNQYKVNAYVCKDRKGSLELKTAIEAVYNNQQFLSPQVAKALDTKNNLEIDNYDINLIKLLSDGLSQDEISAHLKHNKISPSSLSSVEKRLNRLRIQFKANNAIHLVSIGKDLGLI